ncbi:MAG: sigma-70 family RNA polymerase sigma factor [Candidatus Peregrinibacteria bacterium]
MVSAHERTDRQESGDEDARLLMAFQSGDAGGLVKKYQPLMISFLRKHLSSFAASRADDLSQQVWVTVVQKAHEIRDPQSFKPWFWRVMYSTVVGDFRKPERRELPCDMEEFDAAEARDGDPALHGISAERVRAVRSAIRALDPMDQEVLVLRHFRGLSYKEIAAVVTSKRHPEGVPIGTVRRRLHVARSRFAEKIARQAPSLVKELAE